MSSTPVQDPSRYPRDPVAAGHVEPSPRRLRGVLGGVTVLDSVRALYVWEHAHYPQYYVPRADVDEAALAPLGDAVRTLGPDATDGPPDTVRIEWDALDEWLEEDEPVFVHARSPFSRVDALRSMRPVRVEIAGTVLAEATDSVMVFETGLPPRRYLPRTSLKLEHLVRSGTVTSCPYKGTTSAYWSARVDGELHEDIAWSYEFPTPELTKISGLVAFYDEKVDTFVEGVALERPRTHFSGEGD